MRRPGEIGIRLLLVAQFIWIMMVPRWTQAQDTTLLDHFQGMVVEDRVQLVWIVKRGNTCDGMVIERSEDGLEFAEIGRIEGLCGNLEQPQRYDFFDLEPVWNKPSFYRLSSRGDVVSATISLEALSLGKNEILIAPHPAENDSRLYFENPKRELHRIVFIGLDGHSALEVESRAERVDLADLDLLSGTYVVIVRSDAGVVLAKGKLVLP